MYTMKKKGAAGLDKYDSMKTSGWLNNKLSEKREYVLQMNNGKGNE